MKRKATKESRVRARMENSLKENVEGILSTLGLSTTEAITLFYKQIELHQGLPFMILIPNEETLKVISDSAQGKGLSKVYMNLAVAFEDMGL